VKYRLALGLWIGATPSVLCSQAADRGAHPHEPSGFVRFAENPGVLNSDGSQDVIGRWVFERKRGMREAEEPDAPASPPGVLQTFYPADLEAGRAPTLWSGWDSAGQYDGQKSKVYFSLWLRIRGQDFENQAVGTKMGFWGYGRDPDRTADNQGFFLLRGRGKQEIAHAFRVEYLQQGHVVRIVKPNLVQRPLFTAGEWHHWEAVFEMNDPRLTNGVLKMWIDGQQTMDFRNMVYATRDAQNAFYNYTWNPTWGGRGGRRTRADVIEFDHVYLSGVAAPGKAVRKPGPQ